MSDEFEDVAERRPASDADDVEQILDELVELVTTAKSMPLSSSVLLQRDDVLELLTALRDALPEELRRARWMLKERDDFLRRTRGEADEILEDARVQSERMVQRTEIVRQAEHRAKRVLEDAEAESRRMRHETEDYVDQKLAGFEIVLDRTLRTVQAGRERLAALPPDLSLAEPEAAAAPQPDEVIFDQDLS